MIINVAGKESPCIKAVIKWSSPRKLIETGNPELNIIKIKRIVENTGITVLKPPYILISRVPVRL